jgi:hypothetical protein
MNFVLPIAIDHHNPRAPMFCRTSRRAFRSSFVALLAALGCMDATGPDARSTSLQTSISAGAVDPTITIRILPNLDGNDITVTAFNRYDVVAGYRTSASSSQVFRSRTSIQYFTPPTGFQPGTEFLDAPPKVGVNAEGQVVSGVISDTAQRAFIWWHNGGTTLLDPTYPFDGAEVMGCGATAITDGGNIGGTCLVTTNNFIAEWRSDGTVIKNECCGVITALTDNEYLTGYTEQLAPPVAFIWKPGAAHYELLDHTTREVSAGLAINPTGWVAGWLVDSTGPDSAAVLWVPGQPVRILSHIGQATGVDLSGNVVGFHRDAHLGPSVAFLWNFATGAHFLPRLPNGGATAAVAISNVNREILGWAIDAHGLKHAVIWTF